jgi:hypothetical protein
VYVKKRGGKGKEKEKKKQIYYVSLADLIIRIT